MSDTRLPAFQFMNDDELAHFDLQIKGRRSDLAREREPREEFARIVRVLDNWYSSHSFGLLDLRFNLAQAGMFAKLEHCGSGYHAGLYKFRSRAPEELAFLDEALSSESEFPEAFSDSNATTAVAKAIAYNISTNQDGLNCWSWEVALRPEGPKPDPESGIWRRAPSALISDPETWEQGWFAEVTISEDEKPVDVLTPVRNPEYVKIVGCAHVNAELGYPPSHPGFDIDDVDNDVEWRPATKITDHNGQFSRWE